MPLAMGHDLTFRTALAAGLGLVAAAGNLVGAYFVVRRDWPRKYLQYFLALGAGYMLAVAFVEVIQNQCGCRAKARCCLC